MGDVIQLSDRQSPKDLERLRQALEREAAEIMKEVVPFGGAGIDGMYLEEIPHEINPHTRHIFLAPGKDPA
jgi:hypothetical protein